MQIIIVCSFSWLMKKLKVDAASEVESDSSKSKEDGEDEDEEEEGKKKKKKVGFRDRKVSDGYVFFKC